MVVLSGVISIKLPWSAELSLKSFSAFLEGHPEVEEILANLLRDLREVSLNANADKDKLFFLEVLNSSTEITFKNVKCIVRQVFLNVFDGYSLLKDKYGLSISIRLE